MIKEISNKFWWNYYIKFCIVTLHLDDTGDNIKDLCILSYPTFKYFNYGKNDEKYTGGRTKDDFIQFMEDPQNPPKPPADEEQWSDEPSAVEHLTDGNFDDFLSKHDSVLVMFYAPCEHLFIELSCF
jgi:hypothetical protein